MIDPLFVHIGHRKCGSTFLQEEVFPKIDALKIMPMSVKVNPEARRLLIYMIRCAALYYDEARVRDGVAKWDANILSSENLVGHGSWEAGGGHQIEPVAHRLQRLFPSTRILFVIRNQRTWVRSQYLDDVKFGYVCGFEQWVCHRVAYAQLNWPRYAPIIKLYQELFGQEKVRVILFEQLFKPETIEGVLSDWNISTDGLENVSFGKKANPAISRSAYHLTRIVNRTIGSKANLGQNKLYYLWRKRGAKAVGKLDRLLHIPPMALDFRGYDDLLKELYSEDNRETARLTSLDLASCGYP